MNKFFKFVVIGLFVLSHAAAVAQDRRPFTWQDVDAWSFIRVGGGTLSPDGKWMSWVSGPTSGDLTLTIQAINDTLKFEFPVGSTAPQIVFSENSKFIAFKESVKKSEADAARKARRPTFDKLHVISLPDTQKVTFEKVRNYSFSGEDGSWLAMNFAQAPAAPGAPRNDNAPRGSDLLLYHMGDKKSFNLGNVSNFNFNKSGSLLAYTVDAADQNGNGVFIREMGSGLTWATDNDKATYHAPRWNDAGNAFALLKSNKNEQYKGDVYSVVGVKNIRGSQRETTLYNGIEDENFPKGKGISEHGGARWSEDLNTLFFGIADLEKSESAKKKEQAAQDSIRKQKEIASKDSTVVAKNGDGRDSTIARTRPTTRPGATPNRGDIEKPDMIIWNWQDTRLQSMQQLQLNRDRNFNLASAYHLKEKKFVQLSDSAMRGVSLPPQGQYALGFDNSLYEFGSNLDGQRYTDVYLVNIETGERTQLFERLYQSPGGGFSFSPDGKFVAYYQGGDHYTMNLATRQIHNLTGNINASFIRENNDHNVVDPATPTLGWSEDSRFVLIRDNYDLWRISADGRSAVALTNNWKNDKLSVSSVFRIYPDDKGIDLKKTQYFSVFNEATKQAGIAFLDAGKTELRPLLLGDNRIGALRKAKYGNTFVFIKEDNITAPEIHVAKDQKGIPDAQPITKNAPNQKDYDWSAGVRLIDYVSDHGDTLQAALYLPANYEPGKSYPTITYIYERLTQDLNQYSMPSFPGAGFNRAVYTSNGYAVLMPDIKYKLNEPGMSAVACVVPAVKAAIATGVVDAANVAIHGHSWGGYQTSFLITQTNIFKAAAAGAPLTNMISMYSLIYWNSGSANQPIFESSQGRLTTGYWDNWDAYARNSPVYHIKNVETPLLLLHNDKDGAVDYTQGIEYYNGLRRLNKPVVMITYKGENHGIVKEPNKKDYAVRMLEFFDHHLKAKKAPDWWEKGIDLIDMDKHLEERAF